MGRSCWELERTGLQDGTKEGMDKAMHEPEQGGLVEPAFHPREHGPPAWTRELPSQELTISGSYGMSLGI